MSPGRRRRAARYHNRSLFTYLLTSTRHVHGSEKTDLGSDPTDPALGSVRIIYPALQFIERSVVIIDPGLIFCLRSSEIIDPHLLFCLLRNPRKSLIATHKRSV